MSAFFPQDSGPLYAETVLRIQAQTDGFWIEPLNTWSNFLFLLVLLVFYRRLWRSQIKPTFFLLCLPILTLGFVGGVLYHGLRSWDVWYYLDFVPILVLSQLVALYFWIRSGRVLIGVFTMLFVQSFFLMLNWTFTLSAAAQGTLFYVPLALNVVLAVLVASRSEEDFPWGSCFSSIVLIVIALFFRHADQRVAVFFPWGSHFLWHVFGALSTYFLCELLWRQEMRRLTATTL